MADGSYDFSYYPNNLTVQSPTDFGKTKNTSAVLTFNHQIKDNLSFSVVQRYIYNNFDWTDHFVSGAIRNDSINRGYSTWDYEQFSWQTTAFMNYTIKTGKITHSLLAGVDYNNFGWYKNDYRNSRTTRISILNPDYSNDVPALDPANDFYDDNKQTTNLVGGYLQDQISFGKKFKLLFSLRHDSYKLKQTPLSSKDDLQGDTSNATAWLPRAGFVYMPLKNMSFYGSYNKSFNPQLSNSGGRGGPFPPRTAEQFEIGYKADLFRNFLSAMVSFYSISYRNILAADPLPNNPNHQSVVSGTKSQGVELTLQGNIKNLSVIAGYAYNDHTLTSDNTLGKKGFRYVNAPRNVANTWIKYNFTQSLKGIGLGAGARYMSNQVGNLANQDFLIPASTVIDAALNYGINRFNFQFNVNNLTNKRYFNGGLSRVTVASLGNPINFRFGFNYLIN